MARKEAIKGITVEIGGETTELDKALKEVNKQSSSVGQELKDIEKLLKFDPTNTELLAQKQKLLGDNVETAKKRLEALTAAQNDMDKALASGKIGDGAYREFEREIISAEQALQRAEGSASEFGNEVKDAGTKAKKSGTDAKDGEGGWSKLGDGIKKAGEIAAKAMAAMGTAAVAAGTALVAASKSGAEYADNVLTMSAQSGIATDKLQEYMYAAELVDVPVETLTKSMAKQIKSMKAAQDGTKSSVEAYESLGVATTNADGSLRNSQDVYWEVIDALGNIENETERDAVAMQLLGKSAQELNPLIEAGSGAMQELGDQAHAAGYVLSDESLDAFGAFDDGIQTLKVGAEAAKNALGTILLPALTTLAEDGTALLGEFTNGINNADGDTEALIGVFADTLNSVIDKIAEYAPAMIDAGMEIIDSLIEGITDNIPKIVQSAVSIVTRLAEGLIEALPKLAEGAVQIIRELATALKDALPELVPAAVEAILTLTETIVENLDGLVDAAIEIVLALTEGIIDALPILLEEVPEIIVKLVEAIIRAVPKLLEAADEIIKALIEGCWKAIPALYKAIGEIFANLFTKIKDYYANAAKESGEAFRALFSRSLEDTWRDLTAWFGEVIDFFRNLPQTTADWFERGKNAIADWWNEADRAEASTEDLTKTTKKLSEELNQGEKDWQAMLDASVNFQYQSQNTSKELDIVSEAVDEAVKKSIELQTEYRGLVDSLEPLQDELKVSGVSLTDMAEIMLSTETDVETLKKTIEDFSAATTNAFEKIKEKTAISLDEMIDNLEYNQKAVQDWTTNLGILADRGLDEGLLQQLREMGPEGAGYVRELVEASDKEIQELNDKLRKGAEQAVDSAIEELRDSIQSARQAGSDFAGGFIAGLHDQEPQITYSTSQLGQLAASTLRNSLQEQSPSKVTRRIGEYFGEGFTLGIGSMKERVERITSSLAGDAVRALSVDREFAGELPKDLNRSASAALAASYGDDGLRNIELPISVIMNGTIVGKVISRVQYDAKRGRARVSGVPG